MLGRDIFMQSLRAHGVTRMFGNPGTTESPLLDHLADYPEIDYIVALHEGVAVGAASFYAQASGKTGIVNVHVAPGLGNGVGMIFNGLKANTPMIVTAGQQDTRMRLRGPVLGHDLVAIAAPVVKWSVQVETADEMADIMRRAFKIAHDPPMGPVFVALPVNVMEQQSELGPLTAGPLYRASQPDAEGVAAMAALLSKAKAPVIVAGDDVARRGASGELTALAETLGASIWVEGIHAQAPVASSHPLLRGGLPFEAATIRRALGDADCVLMVGGPFFEEVWHDQGSPFPAGAAVLQIEEAAPQLAKNHELTVGLVGGIGESLRALQAALRPDAGAALGRLTALTALKAEADEAWAGRVKRAGGRRPMAMSVAMAALAKALPDNAVLVEEAITASLDFARAMPVAGPGSYYAGRGGGIGQGLAGAIGVAVANPDRPTVCVSGDGSAMYSIQALWTAAHHNLPILFVILANREYRVLKHNIDAYRSRFAVESNRGYTHMDLTGPAIGYVELAGGMGVKAERVTEPDVFQAAVARAIKAGGPHLIEVSIEGKP